MQKFWSLKFNYMNASPTAWDYFALFAVMSDLGEDKLK